MKDITYGQETREKLARGISKLVDTVRHTLGASAGHTVLGFEFANPLVLDDGALIARQVEFTDPTENVGAQLARMVSEKTNRIAGDGTTTSLVLADAMVKALMDADTGFATPTSRRENLVKAEETVKSIIQYVKDHAVPVSGSEDIYRVAYISSGNAEIATHIANAYKELGDNVTITQQDSKKDGMSVKFQSGISFPSGVDQILLGNVKKHISKDVGVLAIDGLCTSREMMLDAIKDCKDLGALTVIADDFSDGIIDASIVANERGEFKVHLIKAPYYAEKRSNFLKDVAAYSGGKVLTDKYVDGALGKVGRAEVSSTETILVDGTGDVAFVVKELQDSIESLTSEFDVAWVKERISFLTSGVATIMVGMPSEAEQKAVMAKIEDSIHAVKSALDGGVIPGGGITLFRATNATWGKFEPHRGILEAVSTPFQTIQTNMGVKTEDWGQDVLDPVKVAVQALTNAWSVARMVYLCEAGVVWKPAPADKSDTLG